MSSPEIITRVKVTSNKTIQDIKAKKSEKSIKQTNKNKKHMSVNTMVIMMVDKTSCTDKCH